MVQFTPPESNESFHSITDKPTQSTCALVSENLSDPASSEFVYSREFLLNLRGTVFFF
jgi:hypothetical protein